MNDQDEIDGTGPDEASPEEQRDAELLRALLEGGPEAGAARLPEEDIRAVGLLLHAAGTPPVRQADADRIFARIRQASPEAGAPERPRRSGQRWGLAGYLLAASVTLFLLLRPSAPEPLPPGPSAAERSAAIAALDPRYGPPGQRLAALHAVATRERERLVAEMSHER